MDLKFSIDEGAAKIDIFEGADIKSDSEYLLLHHEILLFGKYEGSRNFETFPRNNLPQFHLVTMSHLVPVLSGYVRKIHYRRLCGHRQAAVH